MKALILSVVTVLSAIGWVSCKPQAGPAGAGPGGGSPMAMQVVATPARIQPVVEEVHLIGTLAANEAVEIKAETDGLVQEVLFDEGQRVKQGQLLVKLDETRLAEAVAEAEASFELSQTTFDRARQLLQDQLISQQEFDQVAAQYKVGRAALEIRRRQLKDARVYAPFSGVTGARQVSPGQVITRNTALTWLVDLDPVKAEVNVPERFLGRIQPGQSVQFTVGAYAGQTFTGEIYFVDPRLDLATRTALMKTRVPNPELLLKVGMVVNLDLQLTLRTNALVIPEAALLSNGDLTFVFVVGASNLVDLRPVEVGERLSRLAEIRAGLQAGEQVVVEGHQKIGPGMPVQLAPAEKAAVYEPVAGGK